MKRLLSVALVLVLLLAIGLVSGCAEKEEPEPPADSVTPTDSVTPPTPKKAQVLVYFIRGEYVGVAGREVQAAEDVEPRAEAAMKALLEGPTDVEKEYGLGTVIPEGTSLNGVVVEGSTATVDLSRRFESGGGSLSMLLRVAQVVYTLTQFEGVSEVAFKLDGEAVEAIGGEGVIVSPPVTRGDFEGQAPPILVESPVPGQTVTSPIMASGSANVFEAQFNVEVKDPDDKIVVQQAIMATSGTGTRGTFEANIEYVTSASGTAAVVFFDISEKDGSRINVIQIPVFME